MSTTSPRNKQTIVVTGAAGFLGSNLVRTLLQREYRVIGVDDLSNGTMSRLDAFVPAGTSADRFRFVQADVRDRKQMLDALNGAQQVVHLAELKIPRYGSALKTLEVNFEGTESVLEAAAEHKVRMVYGSTDEVYGKSPETPLNEEGPLVLGATNTPRWSYATSKVMAEQLCFAFADKYKMPFAILRFSGGYGPGQSLDWQGGPQSVFISAALKNEPLTVHGDGQQSRTFTYVDDMVNGAVRTIEAPYADGEIINISSGNGISIVNLAYLVWRMVGRAEKPKLEFTSYTEFSRNYEDVRHRVPDCAKAKYLIGYEAATRLEDGLRQTIAWQAKALNLPWEAAK